MGPPALSGNSSSRAAMGDGEVSMNAVFTRRKVPKVVLCESLFQQVRVRLNYASR